MKKFILAILLNGLFSVSFAQCRISGKITGNTHPVKLTLLYGDGHYDNPSVALANAGSTSFEITVPVRNPVFAIMHVNDWEQRLLLSPGRDLRIEMNTTGQPKISYSGTAAPENKFLQTNVLDSIPFFMNYPQLENPYAKTAVSEWKRKIIDPIEKDMKQTGKLINHLNIPSALKTLLISEQKFYFQSHLSDLTNNNMNWAKNPAQDTLLAEVMQWQHKPDSFHLISGFYANMIMTRQIEYRVNSVAREAKKNKLKIPEVISRLFNSPFEHVDSLVKTYGERYIVGWLYARTYLPVQVHDKLLLNKILEAANNADFRTCSFLMDTMNYYFPESPYQEIAAKEVKSIRQKISSPTKNNNIRFREPGSVNSLSDLVKPYAGKIVYLDIWGTWCGPCRYEMKYVAELKKKFKDKDVVFVYLDMDENVKETTWKEYLSYYNIEGEHYRMNRAEIATIWDEIKLAGGKEGSYPTFVLIGRDGKIINPDAERPGSKEKLYTQIGKVL